MTENQRVVVQVRLTTRDKKRVEAAAVSDRVAVSDFVRRLTREALDEERATARSKQ
jgi:hypothetical protein